MRVVDDGLRIAYKILGDRSGPFKPVLEDKVMTVGLLKSARALTASR